MILAKEHRGNASPEAQVPVDPIHVARSSRLVFFWIPDGANAERVRTTPGLSAWVRIPGIKEPQQLAPVDTTLLYRQFGVLRVARPTLDRQADYIRVPPERSAVYPSDAGTLKDVIDRLCDVGDDALRTTLLQRIAVECISPTPLRPDSSMGALLAATQTPQRRAQLATADGFGAAMRRRLALFQELEDVLAHRRLVFLSGGEHSYLFEFIEGFKQYLHGSAERLHVEASFSAIHHRLILNDPACQAEPPHHHRLAALLASLAYSALHGLAQQSGQFFGPVYTQHMHGDPKRFARRYLNQATESNVGDLVLTFAETLNTALSRLTPSPHLTVFLPFHRVIEVVREADDDTRQQLFEGLSALDAALAREPERYALLGLVITGAKLPLDRAATDHALVRSMFLRVPPLSDTELAAIVGEYLGRAATPNELTAIDARIGGAPWLLFCLLRLAEDELRAAPDATDSVTRPDLMLSACETLDRQWATVRAGGTPETEVAADLAEYLRFVSRSIKAYSAMELGLGPLFRAAKNPDGGWGERTEVRDEDEAWIDAGVLWPHPRAHAARGVSLQCLRDYPKFRYSRAGDIPLSLMESVK